MILPMARVELLGPRALLLDALALLQRHGALELRPPRPHAGLAAVGAPCGAAADEARGLLDALRAVDALRARLPARPRGAAPGRDPPLPDATTPAFAGAVAALGHALDDVEARRAALVEERDAIERFVGLVVALAPLPHGLDLALAPELHAIVLGPDPAALALLEAEVRRISGGACEVRSKALDAERIGVLVAIPRAHGGALAALLHARGVDAIRLPSAYAGKSVAETLLLLSSRRRALAPELAAAEASLAALAGRGPELAAAAGRLRAALARVDVAGRCGETRFAFVVTGYMAAERVPALEGAVAAAFGAQVALLARPPSPDEWPEVPVVLRNRGGVRPFERLLALVPLPRYGSIDPTPWLALFFPLFFGLVLGDVVFGVLGVAAALLARARSLGGALGRDVAWIALWCSVSAALFGVAFGEALGELGEHVGLHPLVLDRRHAVLAFLWGALAVGAAHLSVGLALGITSAARHGHAREAVARGARLALVLLGCAAAAAGAGVAPRAVLAPALACGGAALVVAIGAEGPMAALELVLGLGNVLSYARLMALGLASVMLAAVANRVATALEPAAAGIAIGVLLHAVNFTLGLVSPAIAALRLHYVEFFEKFYDEGGAPFRPFALGA